MTSSHLLGLLRVDLDGVDAALSEARLVEVGTVAELLLLVRHLRAVGHGCGRERNHTENRVELPEAPQRQLKHEHGDSFQQLGFVFDSDCYDLYRPALQRSRLTFLEKCLLTFLARRKVRRSMPLGGVRDFVATYAAAVGQKHDTSNFTLRLTGR